MSLDTIHRVIVAYDVSLDSRRNRVAKTLESFSDRIQFSVFLVDAKPAKIVRLRAALQSKIDTSSDSVLIFDLGPLAGGGEHRMQFLGLPPGFTDCGPLVM